VEIRIFYENYKVEPCNLEGVFIFHHSYNHLCYTTLMNALFFLITGLLFGGLAMYGYQQKTVRSLERDIARTRKELAGGERDFAEVGNLDEFNQRQVQKKAERKERIVGLSETQDKVQNSDVADLLDVSSATAYNYLEELETEGKIEQVGKKGRSVVYKRSK